MSRLVDGGRNGNFGGDTDGIVLEQQDQRSQSHSLPCFILSGVLFLDIRDSFSALLLAVLKSGWEGAVLMFVVHLRWVKVPPSFFMPSRDNTSAFRFESFNDTSPSRLHAVGAIESNLSQAVSAESQ
jgi:hypothetical protein